MGRAGQIERIIAKGQVVPFTTTFSAPTAGATVNAAGFVVPWEYEILGVSALSSATVADGLATVSPTVNGSVPSGHTYALLDETVNTNSGAAVIPRGKLVGAAGDVIGAQLATDADWDTSGGNVTVTIWVLAHLEGV